MILDLNDVVANSDASYVLINLSGQLQGTKTLYIEDNNFTALCVKDAEMGSILDMSSDCDGAFEIDFTSCLGNSSNVTIGGGVCADLGDRIRVELFWGKGGLYRLLVYWKIVLLVRVEEVIVALRDMI